jgi:hypothetical protein
MRVSLKVLMVSAFLACITLSSCATWRANRFLVSHTTDQQKADLLCAEGKKRFEANVVAANNLSAIPEAKRFFSDAIAVYPDHAEAKQYLQKIEDFKKKQFTDYKQNAIKLSAVKNRTAAQDYDLVYSAMMAARIDGSDSDVQAILKSTKDLKVAVILAKETELGALQQKIGSETAQTALIKGLRDANRIADDLSKIDPGNKAAAGARKSVAEKGNALIQKDIDAASAALSQAKYGDAEDAVLRAEKNSSSISGIPEPRITDLKYRVYYEWSLSLFNAKKYPQAADRILSAINTRKTAEAVALKAKIDKSVDTRDTDSDISDILASVDARIAKDDPGGAMDIIEANLPKLKAQANRDKLAAKKDAVRAQLKSVYQQGVLLYNEEDYEGARQKFRTVIDVDSSYEQAQAYLDRTETKIKALSGKN